VELVALSAEEKRLQLDFDALVADFARTEA
jgi:hypothetical protein